MHQEGSVRVLEKCRRRKESPYVSDKKFQSVFDLNGPECSEEEGGGNLPE